MGERARRRSGKRSGQRMAPRQRTGGRVASPRSESRFLSAACACGRTGEPGDAQHASEREVGAAKAVRRQRRRLGGGVAHFGCEGWHLFAAVVWKSHEVPRHFGNNFTHIPSHPLFRVEEIGCSDCEAHSNGRLSLRIFSVRPPQHSNAPRYGSHFRARAANGRRTKARRICRAAAPSATQRGKAGTQIAGRAGCHLQQHMRTQSASFGRLRIQPSGRSCRRACVA